VGAGGKDGRLWRVGAEGVEKRRVSSSVIRRRAWERAEGRGVIGGWGYRARRVEARAMG